MECLVEELKTLKDNIELIDQFIESIGFPKSDTSWIVKQFTQIYQKGFCYISLHSKYPIGWTTTKRYSFGIDKQMSLKDHQTHFKLKQRYINTPVQDQEAINSRYTHIYEFLAGCLLGMSKEEFKRVYLPEVILVVDAVYYIQEKHRELRECV